MATVERIEPTLMACLLNAERLIQSARAVMTPGQHHVAYHLAALAMEEIGKAGLILTETVAPEIGDDSQSLRSKWMEDHERKLFWALWLPSFDGGLNWQKIPEYLDFASAIHERRKRTLYFDPEHPDAQAEISEDLANNLITLTESRLKLEKLKQYRDLDEEEQSDLHWFFIASRNPDMKGYIFSKESLEMQSAMQANRNGWIRWLRGQVEESAKKAMELARLEMERQRPIGREKYKDKWKLRLRLRSWSHSIRPNQLTGWNKGISKMKLIHTADRSELIVEFTIGKNILLKDLWAMGMQSSMIFLCALNIATGGFFWWYVPSFTSRFYESITDLETNHNVLLDRVPELKIAWGHMALKEEDLLGHMPMVFGFVAKASETERNIYHRYFGMLGLLAKNDIFFQFEVNLVGGLTECIEMAMTYHEDWNGDPATFDTAVAAVFVNFRDAPAFVEMLKDLSRMTTQIKTQKFTSPVTLADVARTKIIFEVYIRLKAATYMRKQIASGALKPETREDRPVRSGRRTSQVKTRSL